MFGKHSLASLTIFNDVAKWTTYSLPFFNFEFMLHERKKEGTRKEKKRKEKNGMVPLEECESSRQEEARELTKEAAFRSDKVVDGRGAQVATRSKEGLIKRKRRKIGERSRKGQGEGRRREYKKEQTTKTGLLLGDVRRGGCLEQLALTLLPCTPFLFSQDKSLLMGKSDPTNPSVEKHQGHHYTSGTRERGREGGREGEDHKDRPLAFVFYRQFRNPAYRRKVKRTVMATPLRAIVCDDNGSSSRVSVCVSIYPWPCVLTLQRVNPIRIGKKPAHGMFASHSQKAVREGERYVSTVYSVCSRNKKKNSAMVQPPTKRRFTITTEEIQGRAREEQK